MLVKSASAHIASGAAHPVLQTGQRRHTAAKEGRYMVRTVKGVTLSSDERIQAGYSREKVKSHLCAVVLPNGVSCEVSYTRTSGRVHAFTFGDPLLRTHYVYEAIPGGIPDIEAKASELVPSLFSHAQQEEQKQMRQKAPAGRTAPHRDTGPQIGAKIAAELAGRYAACVRTSSGNLIRVGATFSAPEGALGEIQAGRYSAIRLIKGQQLVVGICSRAAQRWEEPSFLKGDVSLLASRGSGTEIVSDPAEDLEYEEEEPNIAMGYGEDLEPKEGGEDEE